MILKEPNIIEVGGIGCNVAAVVQNVVRYFGMCLFCCEGPTTRTLFLPHPPLPSKHHESQTCPFFVHNHDQQNKVTNPRYLIDL